MSPYLEKVTSFVTRRTPRGAELLLFQHPFAGVQLPAGTVELDERLEQAALREAREETGLEALRVVQAIGSWIEPLPEDIFYLLRRATVYARPETSSRDFAYLPRGYGVRVEHRQGDWAHVTYEEWDRYPDPQYNSYQITGWVPAEALAEGVRRHFFHLEALDSPPAGWTAQTDGHVFRPFWAPLNALPEIFETQHRWLVYVRDELGYRF